MSQPCSNERSPSSRRVRAATLWSFLGVVGVAASGCYTYQPLDDGPVPRETETVRVELTGAGEDAMAEQRGIQLETFEGRVLDENGDRLTMEVRLPANRLAFSDRAVTDTLDVLRPHIRTLDVKQFSSGRTTAAVVGSVAGAALLYGAVDAALNSGDGGGGEGDNIDFSVVPFITSVLGWLR